MFQGFAAGPLRRPRGLTIAVSREAGSRGGTVARKVGQLLGWQVFGQEMLDYLVQDDTARGRLFTDVPPGARDGQLLARPAGGGGRGHGVRAVVRCGRMWARRW